MKFKIICLIGIVLGYCTCSPADTMWGIRAAYTSYGSTTLMNMYADKFRPLEVQLENSGGKGKYRYLRFGAKKGVINAAMNEAGVAVTFSYADSNLDKKPNYSHDVIGGSALCVEVAETCRTAIDAVSLIEQTVMKQHRMMDSAVFLVADFGHLFLIECSPEHCEWTEAKGGFAVYAQCWHLPGMEFISTVSPETVRRCYGREWTVRKNLSSRYEKNKNVLRRSDSFAVARIGNKDVSIKDGAGAPHEENILGSVLLVINDEYPEVLSTAYVAIGKPCGTLFFPIPLGVNKIPEVLADMKWQKTAVSILKNGGNSSLNKILRGYENQLLIRYAELCNKIRGLEFRRQHREAVVLLNSFVNKEAVDAYKMLQQISQKQEKSLKKSEKTDAKNAKQKVLANNHKVRAGKDK